LQRLLAVQFFLEPADGPFDRFTLFQFNLRHNYSDRR
jgi:hypothetical protein